MTDKWFAGAARMALALSFAIGGLAPATLAQPARPAAATAPVRLELIAPTGANAIGTTQLHLVDASRPDPWTPGKTREVMISIWYPAAATDGRQRAAYMSPGPARLLAESLLRPIGQNPARVDFSAIATHAFQDAPAKTRGGPYPVVLYSPGGNMPRTLGTTLVEDLASRGYVVVTIDHTYEAGAVEFPGGRVEVNAQPKGDDVLRRMLAARVADTRFVIDQLEALKRGRGPGPDGKVLPEGLRRVMDLSRMGMFGHSAGGFTAFETASVDKRLDAVADLDGSLGYAMSQGVYGSVVEKGLSVPFMFLGAGVSGTDRKPHTHVWAREWTRLWERSSGWKRDFYIARAEHMAFADHEAVIPQLAAQMNLPAPVFTAAIGAADSAKVITAERAYIAAFFDQHLKRKRQPLLDAGAAALPEVEVIR